MFRGICSLPVQVVDIIRPVGIELSQLQFQFLSILDSLNKNLSRIQKYFQHTSPVDHP